MTFIGVLHHIVGALDKAGIPHMVAGSVASSHHGEPRSTQDIDIVIDPTPEALERFVAALDPADHYIGDAARALADRSEFNIISLSTGWKVDMIVCRDRPFSRSELVRSRPADIGGVRVNVATAEDTILAKLEWGAASGSERQRNDVAAVIRARGVTLDVAYLRHWADQLGLTDALNAVLP